MKRKTIKKAASVFLASVLTILPLFGCSQQEGETSVLSSSSVSQNGEAGSEASESKEPVQENVEITVFREEHPDMPVGSDVYVFKKITENTGVSMKFEQSPADSSLERYNLMIAGGDVPDLVIYYTSNLLDTTEEGPFLALEDLLPEQAPNVWSVMDGNENILRESTSMDGHVYIIPGTQAIRANSMHLVRQDWLDKFGLEKPQTADEYYEMLKIFKEQDANGNGEDDEIPFTTRHKSSGLSAIIEFFGIDREWFIEGDQVLYGITDPRMKEAVVYLNKLYAEGLIDPDYMTNTQDIWQAKVTNNQVGTINDLGSRLEFFNELIPESPFVGMLPPAADGVEPGTFNQKSSITDSAASIGKESEYVSQILNMFNYIFSDEGTMLLNFGGEGEHYTLDGEDITRLTQGNDANLAGINTNIPFIKDIRFELSQGEEVAQARQEYEPILRTRYPNLLFTKEEKDVISSKYTDIKTFVDENFDKFVTGIEPLDNWDSFVEQVKDLGIEEIVDIQNAAYQRYISA